MYDLATYPWFKTPLGLSVLVGLLVMVYLFLMSFSIYLPTILILSVAVGAIVYQSQTNCLVEKK